MGNGLSFLGTEWKAVEPAPRKRGAEWPDKSGPAGLGAHGRRSNFIVGAIRSDDNISMLRNSFPSLFGK